MRGHMFPLPPLNLGRGSCGHLPPPTVQPNHMPTDFWLFPSWKRICVGTASARIERLSQLFTPQCSTFWQTNSGRRSSRNGQTEWRNLLPLVTVASERANKAAWRVIAMTICNLFCTFFIPENNVCRRFLVYLLSHSCISVAFQQIGSWEHSIDLEWNELSHGFAFLPAR